jgi:glycosyltransferase involved in cell wall biosynthesis
MPGPLPVLILVTTFDRGGAEKIVTRLAVGLSGSKYSVLVAALQWRSGAIAADLMRAGVPVHDLRMRAKWDLGAFVRLCRLLHRHRTRVLLTFMFHPTVLGRLAGWVCRVPVRISSERIMAWEGVGRRWLNRLTLPLATHVVAVCEHVAAYVQDELRVAPRRLSTIPNGVDPEHFRARERSSTGAAPIVGCTARLHAKNDHETLLRAFAYVSASWPEVRLHLVGRGPEEERLRALTDELGLVERVSFLGEQADVAPCLREMGIYVQSSVAEGLSNSILEAMAAGLPVVATTVGGTSELVVDSETGFLVPPRNPKALAAAIERLLADRATAASFGRAGRARTEAHFTEAAMIQRFESLFDRLVHDELGLCFEPVRGWATCR